MVGLTPFCVGAELGNNPEVYPESHNNGNVTLVCMSSNWKSKPAIDWIDEKGEILQHAGNSQYCYSDDTTLYVKRSVTVQENHGYNYTCRVSYLKHRRNETYSVPREYQPVSDNCLLGQRFDILEANLLACLSLFLAIILILSFFCQVILFLNL